MSELVYLREINRSDYLKLLENNQKYILFKFGAEWCKPCQSIKTLVENKCKELPKIVQCYDIDVDESFDVYAFMKSKKMVKTIPSLLIYKKDNTSYPPDFSLFDSDLNKVSKFLDIMKD